VHRNVRPSSLLLDGRAGMERGPPSRWRGGGGGISTCSEISRIGKRRGGGDRGPGSGTPFHPSLPPVGKGVSPPNPRPTQQPSIYLTVRSKLRVLLSNSGEHFRFAIQCPPFLTTLPLKASPPFLSEDPLREGSARPSPLSAPYRPGGRAGAAASWGLRDRDGRHQRHDPRWHPHVHAAGAAKLGGQPEGGGV